MSAGLRKRRVGYFVQIPRESIRDRSISWKARGLLGFILDQAPGWQPSIDELAQWSDKDGRSATQTGLQELRTAGYYRVERRRLLNGRFTMGVAVSEVAVPEWASENAAYGDKPIPLVQQPDGTYRVLLPDGTLAPDGFDTDDEGGPAPDPGPHTGSGPGSANPQVTPDAGFPDPENPVPGEPGPRRTRSPENPEPKDKDQKPPRDQTPGTSLRDAPPEDDHAKVIDIDTVKAGPQPDHVLAAAAGLAREIVEKYMDWWKADRAMPADRPIPEGTRVFHQLVGKAATRRGCSYVTAAILQGYTRNEIATALGCWAAPKTGRRPSGLVPAKGAWTEALAAASAGREVAPVTVTSRQQAEQERTNRMFDDAMARAVARDEAEAAARAVSHG